MSDTNLIDFVDNRDEVELLIEHGYDLAPDLIGIVEDVFLGREDFIEYTADDIGITDTATHTFGAINGYDTITVSDQTIWLLEPEYDYDPDLIGVVDYAQVILGVPSTGVLNDADAVFLGTIAAVKVYVGEYEVWP